MSMRQRNASHALAALAALVAVGGAGLAATAQTAQPYPPAPGVPVPTEPANRIPPAASGGSATRASGERRGTRAAETPRDDVDFVRMLLAANTAELDEAKYMLNRTTNATVRSFAQQMVGDHSTAAVKLQAATRGVALGAPPPRLTTSREVRGIELLAMLSGPQRDAAYMRMQVGEHRRAIALMEWESQNGKVPTLKELATELLPTVSMHAQMALAYQASGGTSMAVDAVAPAGTAPNGTLPNNPATSSGGQTSGAAGSPVRRGGNPNANPSGAPTLSQPTPAPGSAPTSAPAPSPSPT
jgi:putative membrane protein